MVDFDRGVVITAKEAAQEGGYTHGYICQLCKRGVFPNAFKLGSVWVIPKNEFRAWLASPLRRRKGRQLPLDLGDK